MRSRLRSRVKLVGLAFLCLVLLAGPGLLVWQGVDRVRANHEQDADRRAVLDVAKAQALALTTLDKESLKGTIASLQKRSTGAFRDQMTALSSTFTSVIAKQDVVSKGAVVGAGVVTITPTSAQVLVAATASVTQKAESKPRIQRYRMSVQLTKKDDGWLISGMEFVP